MSFSEPAKIGAAALAGVLLAILAGAITGCASGPGLSPQEESIPISKTEPPQGCNELQKLSANSIGLGTCDVHCQMKHLRKKAARIGANFLRFDSFEDGWPEPTKTTVTAFLCPKK